MGQCGEYGNGEIKRPLFVHDAQQMSALKDIGPNLTELQFIRLIQHFLPSIEPLRDDQTAHDEKEAREEAPA